MSAIRHELWGTSRLAGEQNRTDVTGEVKEVGLWAARIDTGSESARRAPRSVRE